MALKMDWKILSSSLWTTGILDEQHSPQRLSVPGMAIKGDRCMADSSLKESQTLWIKNSKREYSISGELL